MIKGLRLTERDRTLLYDCYSQTVMSFSQIHRRHFPGKSAVTVSNRLGKLRRAGLLRRYPVGIALFMENPEEVGVVYQITRLGQNCLKACYPEETIRDEAQSLALATLPHDLLLNDTMAALKLRFPKTRLIHGKLAVAASTPGRRQPDAIITDISGDSQIAIELELTAKSEARYRDIVLQYLIDSRYQQVLYVVGGTPIADKIRFQITHQKKIAGIPEPSTGKFYFVTLRDLLSDPEHSLVTNGESRLGTN